MQQFRHGTARLEGVGNHRTALDVLVRSLGSSALVRSVAAATLAGVHRSPATVAVLELLAEVSERHVAMPQWKSQSE